MKRHIVPARTGLDWVRQGIQVFWRQPLPLAVLFCMTTAIMFLLSAIPNIGSVIALALQPSITLVMMLAAAEVSQGRPPVPSLLFTPFRSGAARTRSLLILGAIYAALFLLIMAIAALFDDGKLAQTALSEEEITKVVAQNPSLLSPLVFAALYTPLSLLFWHAPGLVYWHNVPPVKALFFSIVACMRNLGAFTLFGIAWLGVFLMAGAALSFVVLILKSAGLSASVVAMLMVPTAMLLATMFLSSIVFTFRDSFVPPDEYGHQVEGPTEEI